MEDGEHNKKRSIRSLEASKVKEILNLWVVRFFYIDESTL